jgi:hypothetical protein
MYGLRRAGEELVVDPSGRAVRLVRYARPLTAASDVLVDERCFVEPAGTEVWPRAGGYVDRWGASYWPAGGVVDLAPATDDPAGIDR